MAQGPRPLGARLLVVRAIEFLDYLVSQIDRVLVVNHNLDGLFAALIEDDRKSAFFCDVLRRGRNFLHVFVDELFLLALKFLIKLLSALLIFLDLGAELGFFVFLLSIAEFRRRLLQCLFRVA